MGKKINLLEQIAEDVHKIKSTIVPDTISSIPVEKQFLIEVSKYISRVDDGYYYGMRNIKQYDASGEYYRLIHFSPCVWLPINYMFDPKVRNEYLEPGNLDIATPLDIVRFERWLSHLITGCTYIPLDTDEIDRYARLSYA